MDWRFYLLLPVPLGVAVLFSLIGYVIGILMGRATMRSSVHTKDRSQ
jgi:hypothetical protein